ncbi:318_t:CDS:10 [Funneliformis caledonium]|uniref:318_t:CDS:1 n=1 Tax=Funneliformis caledonium TaxID=1117310 RepID=A0A9N9ELH3_9GLOM|nr:318_t:CDS:10 [Funneliformis caledonium]
MILTPQCLNAMNYRDFWERTEEPSLKKFLDFRLRSGYLSDMKTEHNRYYNELKTLSAHYAKVSEVGEKVQKWISAFKARLNFILNYSLLRPIRLSCLTNYLTNCLLVMGKTARSKKTACSSGMVLVDYFAICLFVRERLLNAKRTKQNKDFWKMHEQSENINAKGKLLEEKSKLDIIQAQAEMTKSQMDGIVHTAKQLNKGALLNMKQVVSTIAYAKYETRNKRAFDDNQAQLPSKFLRNSPDIDVDEEYSKDEEHEYLRTQTIQEPTQTTTNGLREIINKIENSTHRLFEYRIIDLSNRNVANPVNKIFTTLEKESLKGFWDTSEKSCQFNTRDLKWEEVIKPLLITYSKAFIEPKSMFDDALLDFDVVMEKPYNGLFDYKQHYILLWAPLNKLTDPKQSEFSYREDFISPILARAFEDLEVIQFRTGEIENMLTKTQRNVTEQQKHRIRLGCNQDGIIEISLNAMNFEIGFMEVVGSAIEVDLKKTRRRYRKTIIAMQISMFYQRQHFLQRGATEDKIKCIESYGIVVYQREITIYTMHHVPEGIYVVDILTRFSIPEIKSHFYMIKELIEKIYFFKSPSRTYIQTSELPTQGSPPMKSNGGRRYSLH